MFEYCKNKEQNVMDSICNVIIAVINSSKHKLKTDFKYPFYVGYFYSKFSEHIPNFKDLIIQITSAYSPLLNSIYPKCNGDNTLKRALKYLPNETEDEYIERINLYFIPYLGFLCNTNNSDNEYALAFFYDSMYLQIKNENIRFGINKCVLAHFIVTFFNIYGEKAKKHPQFNELMKMYNEEYCPVFLKLWQNFTNSAVIRKKIKLISTKYKRNMPLALPAYTEFSKKLKEYQGHLIDNDQNSRINEIKEVTDDHILDSSQQKPIKQKTENQRIEEEQVKEEQPTQEPKQEKVKEERLKEEQPKEEKQKVNESENVKDEQKGDEEKEVDILAMLNFINSLPKQS
ncbi:MIF4G domain-containing protein [Entamoeba marina]